MSSSRGHSMDHSFKGVGMVTSGDLNPPNNVQIEKNGSQIRRKGRNTNTK